MTVRRSLALGATLEITLNGQRREVPAPMTVAQLLVHLQLKPEFVAVEVNRDLVGRGSHAERSLAPGDVLERVTLMGGGSSAATATDRPAMMIGTHTIRSRLFVGTGKYATLELMHDCLE